MAEEQVLLDATFSPNAVRYYVVNAVIAMTLGIVTIPFMIIALPIVYLVQKTLYRHIRCTLTTRSLKVRKGVFNIKERTIPLDKITDLALEQGPVMRWLKIEKISVETAGQTSPFTQASVVGIENGREFRDAVLRQRDIVTEHKRDDAGAPPFAPPRADTDERILQTLTDIRDSLRRIEDRVGREP